MHYIISFKNTISRFLNASLTVTKGIKPKTYSNVTYEITDKVGIITGGAKGIGVTFVEKLLQKGLKVNINNF